MRNATHFVCGLWLLLLGASPLFSQGFGTNSGQQSTGGKMTTPPDTLCYELRIYTCHKGKLNDLLKRFRNHTTQLFEQHAMTNVGYWTPLDNPDEKLYYVLSYRNRATREIAWKAFNADPEWQKVVKESEAKGPIVAKVESIFLKSTDFSPTNFRSRLASPIWELQIHHTTPNNVDSLLSRFKKFSMMKNFNFGIINKAFWTPTDASQGAGTLVYCLLTHSSEESARQSYQQIDNDPEWIKILKESEEKAGGPLATKVESVFLYPTDFSRAR
jgi:hypothetical protein